MPLAKPLDIKVMDTLPCGCGKSKKAAAHRAISRGEKKVKKCKTCGCEIENGVNGCRMYDECFNCHPIKYNKVRSENTVQPSYDEMNWLEGRCLDESVD